MTLTVQRVELLLSEYIDLLERGARETAGTEAHANYQVRRASAEAIRRALQAPDLGRAVSIIEEEQRILGSGEYLLGPSGAKSHDALYALRDGARALRLQGRPTAW